MLDLYYRDAARFRGRQDALDSALQDDVNLSPLQDILRYWRSIAFVTCASLLVGVGYIAIAPPQYRAAVVVSIDANADAVVNRPTTATDFNVLSANVDAQVEVMQSEELVRRLAAGLLKSGPPAMPPSAMATLSDFLRPWIGFALPQFRSGAAGTDDPVARLAGDLEKHTLVKRVGLTRLVEISATLPNREDSARVANAYAQAYIADQLQRREQRERNNSEALQKRVEELDRKAQDAQTAVEQLKMSGPRKGEAPTAQRVTLQSLESNAQAYRDLRDKFLGRYAETWQQQFMAVPDAQIVSQAFPPDAKSAPRSSLIVAVSLLIGVSLGSILALLRLRGAKRSVM